jgi:mono/diheme cytochrome c family protein
VALRYLSFSIAGWAYNGRVEKEKNDRKHSDPSGRRSDQVRRLVLVLLLMSWLAAAQQAKTESHQTSARPSGRVLFKDYCASCHAEDGKRAGPAAFAFKVQPPDLTALSRQNGGKFPRDRVVRAIRGDRMPSAHGATDMPVWGPVFQALSDMNPAAVRQRINDLTEHIKSLQVK